jgi:hypothetical protein
LWGEAIDKSRGIAVARAVRIFQVGGWIGQATLDDSVLKTLHKSIPIFQDLLTRGQGAFSLSDGGRGWAARGAVNASQT